MRPTTDELSMLHWILPVRFCRRTFLFLTILLVLLPVRAPAQNAACDVLARYGIFDQRTAVSAEQRHHDVANWLSQFESYDAAQQAGKSLGFDIPGYLENFKFTQNQSGWSQFRKELQTSTTETLHEGKQFSEVTRSLSDNAVKALSLCRDDQKAYGTHAYLTSFADSPVFEVVAWHQKVPGSNDVSRIGVFQVNEGDGVKCPSVAMNQEIPETGWKLQCNRPEGIAPTVTMTASIGDKLPTLHLRPYTKPPSAGTGGKELKVSCFQDECRIPNDVTPTIAVIVNPLTPVTLGGTFKGSTFKFHLDGDWTQGAAVDAFCRHWNGDRDFSPVMNNPGAAAHYRIIQKIGPDAYKIVVDWTPVLTEVRVTGSQRIAQIKMAAPGPNASFCAGHPQVTARLER
jgi:hypothetical protein